MVRRLHAEMPTELRVGVARFQYIAEFHGTNPQGQLVSATAPINPECFKVPKWCEYFLISTGYIASSHPDNGFERISLSSEPETWPEVYFVKAQMAHIFDLERLREMLRQGNPDAVPRAMRLPDGRKRDSKSPVNQSRILAGIEARKSPEMVMFKSGGIFDYYPGRDVVVAVSGGIAGVLQ